MPAETGERMRRDDWKYDEEAWDEKREEGKVALPPEKQCRNCLHWIDRDSLYCSWCGKSQEEWKRKAEGED
ncbi:MAG: hypothetical protein H6Q84_1965 [Deltaproteobacteria bacterium]|nr:hypothetical protein [Deltaproteobacteria bacterium]